MRLTCPNCNAQYEVAEDMVPPDGRDVQCSNCGTTWFQEGRRRDATGDAPRPVRRPATEAPPTAEPAPEPPEEIPVQARPGATADEETLEILRQERAHEARQRAAARRRRQAQPEVEPDELDDAIDAAASAEAARSSAAEERARMGAAASIARSRGRREDSEGLSPSERMRRREENRVPQLSDDVAPPETEEDVADAIAAVLNIDAAGSAKPSDQATTSNDGMINTTLAASGGAMATTAAEAKAATRRDLLPDIEEINSSLRPDERALEAETIEDAEEAPVPRKQGNGFKIGFLLILVIVLAFVLAYLFHAQIGTAIPALADMLGAYVEWVDTKRLWLEGAVDALADSILQQAE